MKKEDIDKRLRLIMKYYGMSVAEFSKEIDIAPQNIYSMLSGRRPIGDGVLNKILISFSNIRREWLINGERPMFDEIKEPAVNVRKTDDGGYRAVVLQEGGSTLSPVFTSFEDAIEFVNKLEIKTQKGDVLKLKLNKSEIEKDDGSATHSFVIDAPDSSDLTKYGITPYSLKQFINDYINGGHILDIPESLHDIDIAVLSEDQIEQIAHDLKLDYNDLVSGLEMVSKRGRESKLIPVIDTAAAAGQAKVELLGQREKWIQIGDVLKDSESAIYVYGNSMIPGYPPGCLLGLKRRYDSFIVPGHVYVIETEGNRYVKRLYYNDDKTAFICLSDNHIKHTDGPMDGSYLYPAFEIPINQVVCFWDVTGVVKRNMNLMIQ